MGINFRIWQSWGEVLWQGAKQVISCVNTREVYPIKYRTVCGFSPGERLRARHIVNVRPKLRKMLACYHLPRKLKASDCEPVVLPMSGKDWEKMLTCYHLTRKLTPWYMWVDTSLVVIYKCVYFGTLYSRVKRGLLLSLRVGINVT